MIGRYIGCACRYAHRARKVYLLPPACGFVGEGGAGEQRAGGTPQIADMGTGVLRTLVEADTGNLAGCRSGELNSDLYRIRVARNGRGSTRAEKAQSC